MRPPTRIACGTERETRSPGMLASFGRRRLTISATETLRCRRGLMLTIMRPEAPDGPKKLPPVLE